MTSHTPQPPAGDDPADYVIPTTQIVGELRTLSKSFTREKQPLSAAVCCDAAERLEALTSQLTQHTEPVAGEVEDGWLLIKRGLYWRPDAQGYTGLKREAGRYDEQEAKFRCDNPDVRMVRASDAADYSPSCGYEARCRDLEQRLLAYDALAAAKDAEIERLTFSIEKRIDACISYQSQRDALRETVLAILRRHEQKWIDRMSEPPKRGGLRDNATACLYRANAIEAARHDVVRAFEAAKEGSRACANIRS